MYCITLHPNHNEHAVILIGFSSTPYEFVLHWLSLRDQFMILKENKEHSYIRIMLDHRSNTLTPEQEEKLTSFKHNKEYPLDSSDICWKEIKDNLTLYVPLEGDAQHYL